MKYQRTQIYLDPEDHRLLRAEAARRGLSLAGTLREVVALHVREKVSHHPAKSFDAIIGSVEMDQTTDVARDQRQYLDQALDDRHAKKLGRPARKPPRRKPRRRATGARR